MFRNGVVVDFRPWDEGKASLALVNGAWVVAEGNPAVPWDDLKDAIVLSEEDIAELNTTGKLPQRLKDLIEY